MPDTEQPAETHTGTAPERDTGTGLSFDRIFIGKDGLRAGWALLLFLVLQQFLRTLLFPLVQWLFSPSMKQGEPMHVGSVLCYEGAALLTVALATWALARVETRNPLDYGLRGKFPAARFAGGFAWGFCLLTALMLCLRWDGLLVITGQQVHGRSSLVYGFVWLIAFLLVGVFEEYSFRGYVQFTLWRGFYAVGEQFALRRPRRFGFWIAAVVTSCYFGSIHLANSGESPAGLIAAGLIGLVFCLSLWRTGSLWWAIGFHTAWDWAQSFLYGVGDSGSTIAGHWLISHPAGRTILSGGATGPEGSVFVLPTIALAALGALLLKREDAQIPEVQAPLREGAVASAPDH